MRREVKRGAREGEGPKSSGPSTWPGEQWRFVRERWVICEGVERRPVRMCGL